MADKYHESTRSGNRISVSEVARTSKRIDGKIESLLDDMRVEGSEMISAVEILKRNQECVTRKLHDVTRTLFQIVVEDHSTVISTNSEESLIMEALFRWFLKEEEEIDAQLNKYHKLLEKARGKKPMESSQLRSNSDQSGDSTMTLRSSSLKNEMEEDGYDRIRIGPRQGTTKERLLRIMKVDSSSSDHTNGIASHERDIIAEGEYRPESLSSIEQAKEGTAGPVLEGSNEDERNRVEISGNLPDPNKCADINITEEVEMRTEGASQVATETKECERPIEELIDRVTNAALHLAKFICLIIKLMHLNSMEMTGFQEFRSSLKSLAEKNIRARVVTIILGALLKADEEYVKVKEQMPQVGVPREWSDEIDEWSIKSRRIVNDVLNCFIMVAVKLDSFLSYVAHLRSQSLVQGAVSALRLNVKSMEAEVVAISERISILQYWTAVLSP